MNIYDYMPVAADENITTLLEHKNVIINHIVSSDNVQPTVYCQEEDEWLVLLEGTATVVMDSCLDSYDHKLVKGDTLFIPAKVSHQITKTACNTLWLTVHIS